MPLPSIQIYDVEITGISPEYLRDFFAAHAIEGLLRGGHGPREMVVEEAFMVADLAMKVRKETPADEPATIK